MTRSVVRIAVALLAVVLLVTGCSGSDDKAAPSDNTATSTTKSSAPAVASRFTSTSTFCTPATNAPAETPKATDDGITANSISITHIRVTLEDLAVLGFAIPIGDPVDQAKKFVGLVNDRCGGINGRKLDLSLVEAPPLAPSGQDPASVAQAACIHTTEDDHAVFAFSGSGWGGQGGAACVTGAHDTIYLTTYNISQEDLAGADNRLYSFTLSSADGLTYLARR